MIRFPDKAPGKYSWADSMMSWRKRIIVSGDEETWTESLLYELQSRYRTVKYAISKVIRGIRNLVKWCPVIYKDRDWDKYFLTHMLYHKLKNMSDYYKTCNIIYGTDKIARDTAIVAECFRRLSEGTAADIVWDYRENHSLHDVDGKKESKNMKDDAEQEKKLEDFYLDLAFRIMKTKMDRWWC